MRKTSRWDYQKKTILFLVMGMVIMLVISASAWAADTKVYKGRLSYHWAPKHYSAIMATKFAEECKKATNGRLDIENARPSKAPGYTHRRSGRYPTDRPPRPRG